VTNTHPCNQRTDTKLKCKKTRTQQKYKFRTANDDKNLYACPNTSILEQVSVNKALNVLDKS